MPENYIQKLEETLNARVETLAAQMAKSPTGEGKPPSLEMLLKIALKNEWETAVLTSHWITTEKDPEFAMKMARLAGDEAKHFGLIQEHMQKKNWQIPGADFFSEQTPLFKHLIKYTSTFERIVAGPFTRETLAVARNEVFLNYCQTHEYHEVVKFYETIQQDEQHHFNLGREYLAKYLKTDQDFSTAVKIVEETLKVVGDIQEMMIMKKGLSHLPGC